MATKRPQNSTVSQQAKFQDAARALGCDEDPAHFDKTLKKVARHKALQKAPPESKKPKSKNSAR